MNNGFFKLSKELTYKLNSLPRGRLYDNINNTCLVPKTDVTIDKNSDCFLCFCDGFLPIPIGKILDFDTIEDLFNSQTAKIIQTDVNDRKFTWCAVEHCGIVDRNMVSYSPLDIGYYMSLNLDESCNLACPSCRREKIKSGTILVNIILNLKQMDY
jgi:hypothetical protein